MSLAPRTLTLSATEAKLVSYLDDFASHSTPPVQCRIAGGWVRDKLLSLPSVDLDIALTTSSGFSFAVTFVEYLKTRGISTGSVGQVAANPEKSKHLETGTTKILDLECDFVGLRSEKYADSRIPSQVELGTPLEDALRRDLTINSLFYNVHSRQVEDYTGHGLQDLDRKIARTPLPPLQTFHDDPLRVLRCVRFASRFGLQIETSVVDAMCSGDVKSALRNKVSKERIGIEVMKMMQKNPLHAIRIIDHLQLHSTIFTGASDPPRGQALLAAEILSHVEHIFPGDDMLWLAAATVPFDGIMVAGKKEVPAVCVVIGDGLKLGNEIRDAVKNLFAAANLLDPSETSRSAIGLTLRQPAVRPWRRSIVWATVMAILPTWNGEWGDECQRIIARYTRFVQLIEDLGLPAALDQQPMLRGKQLESLLHIPPGPIFKIIGDAIIEWQLDRPEANVGQCEEWVKAEWSGRGRERWEAQVPPVLKRGKNEKKRR